MTDRNKDNSQLSPKVEEPTFSFTNQLKEWGNSISETLIRWQEPNETELFRVLNMKRKFESLEEDERKYFKNYVDTFRIEVFSGLITFPLLYLAAKYKQEMNKSIKDVPKVNRYLKRLFFFGIPSVNVFLFAIYRRYFYTSAYEAPLKLKYNKEIRDFKKILPKEQKEASSAKV